MASFSPHSIRNKIKRVQVVQAVKAKKAADKRERREARKQVEVELGSSAPPKPVARTLDNTREWDDTYVDKNDPELLADEADDEFADIFSCSRVPKIMITTKVRPSGRIFHVLRELMSLFPNSFYYKRGSYELKKICKYAANKDFTHLFVVSEKKKSVNGLLVVKLPGGPSAFFKLTSFTFPQDIAGHGRVTDHAPEIILNRFETRLGRRMARLLGSMFPQQPDLKGRRIITFHNQRDFVFVRQHRYMPDSREKVRLQELGPRFTLKLKWLLSGAFDPTEGEYEWMHKRHDMDTTRRKFHM